ncbi:OsmC family protein [Christensenellaceae bacterium OttesenSCG-928-K19]|nr:OsmC family protein [Christensenellaceae bacterium OttesenSCG-928-K19]
MIETLKTTVCKLDGGMKAQATVREFTINMDEPQELGGSNTAANPVETLLAALGGCQVIAAYSFAKSFGINLEEFRVEVEGDIDTDGFKGKAGVRTGLCEVRFKIFIKTDAPQEKAEEFVTFVENICPVGDSLKNTVTLNCTDIVIER